MKRIVKLACASVSIVALSAPAFAQGAAGGTSADNAENSKEIVVTGTLVRGVAATGASPISISEQRIEETGATSVAQVLESIPQLASFGTLQQPLANSQEVSVNRPNLRNLPGFNTAGGSTTLVLLDGHRIVGMGNASTGPDPDVIPPGVIQRLEIVPDGGSAIYGSDAVAGVLNFITIKRFDGVKIDGSYGFADDYFRYDGNITAGKDWGSGSIFASYNYAKSDLLLGKDRDYIKQFPDTNGFLSLECAPGNVRDANPATPINMGVFAAPALARGTANQCDASDFATVFPASKRHSAFAGLTQELTDNVTFELRAFYTNRKTLINNGPFRFTQLTSPLRNPAVPGAVSPFAIGPFFTGRLPFAQFVSGQFGANDEAQTTIELDTFGITPTVTADLGSGLQLRVLGSYGESTSNFRGDSINALALIRAVETGSASFAPPFAVTGGIFNPYDPSSAAPGVLSQITNFQQYGRTRQYFQDVSAILDGDLFQLSAGAVKFAAGFEYTHEEFDTQNGTAIPGFASTGFAGSGIIPAQAGLPRFNVSRNVKSAFGEIVAPLLKTDGGMSLTVSLAGRYDDYSDVGSTFNPRFGVTFKPVDWITIFGAWGESFNAPSLADGEDAGPTSVFILGGSAASFFAPPAPLVAAGQYPAYDGRLIVAQRGNAPNIVPQEAKTYTLGFDAQPPALPGFNVGATYFNIKFDNQIGLAPFETPALLYQNFGNLITAAPAGSAGAAAIDVLVRNALAGADIVNLQGGPAVPPAGGVYAFFDARKRNLGRVQVDGIDMRLNYRGTTGFGSVFVNTNGSYILNLRRSNTATTPFFETITNDASRFSLRTSAGFEVGPVLGQMIWNHREGYTLRLPAGFRGTTLGGQSFVQQSYVKDFDTFDLFFKFDLGGDGVTKDLSFTVNVQNVFDKDPPEFRGGSQVAGQLGIANGNTLGRLVTLGISKKF